MRQHAAGQLLDLFLGLLTGHSRGVIDEKCDHSGFVHVGLPQRAREFPRPAWARLVAGIDAISAMSFSSSSNPLAGLP